MPSSPHTVIVSSAGTSTAIALDWMAGGNTTIRLSNTSTQNSGGGVMQFTLDDIAGPSTGVSWTGLSSAFGSTVAGLVVNASGTFDVPYVWALTSPVAALRFSCSAISSGSFVLEVLQQY